jgi:YVTN family beta-propeller protein
MHSLHNYDLRLALQRGIPFADPNGYPGTIVATWPVGDIYGTVVVGGFIYAAVAGSSPGIVRKIDLATGLAVLDITVGDDPRGLCFDGANIWCANYNSAGVPPGNTVSKIDVVTDAVVATITVGSKPCMVEFDGTHVWVACTGSTSVSKIDILTNAVTGVAIGISPGCVAFDNRGYVLFGSAVSTSLKRVRTSTNAVTTLVMPTVIYGMCSAAGFVWATDFNTKVNRIDRMNLSVNTITLPHSPTRRPGFDGKRVWVPCGSSGYTVVIDTETNAVVTSIHTGSASDRFVSFDGDNAYISIPTGLVKVALI